jgi:hypothetical protein
MNVQTVVIRSRGFSLWKQYEAINGRVKLEKVAEDTGLGLSTVRKFVSEPDADVTGAAILGAWMIARYFGTTLDGLLYVVEEASERA